MRTKVVTIGGGNGLSTLLKGLKELDFDISAIVSIFDNGGSTGILRKEYHIPAVGDIRRVLAVLSQKKKLAELFEYRFDKGSLKGHKFGNLFICAFCELFGSFKKAINEASRITNITGQVIPVSLDYADLVAELENGTHIKGETNIDIPKHDGNVKIKKIRLSKSCQANPEAITAIKNADYIIIGPGDLFTSVIPNFLPVGVINSLIKSKAKQVYICNIKTKFGETNNFTVVDYVKTVKDYLRGKILDYVIYNNKIIDHGFVMFHEREFNKYEGIKFIGAGLVSKSNSQNHDSKKIAKIIKGIVNGQESFKNQ